MNAAAACFDADGMLEVKHLVVEEVLDGAARRVGTIEDAGDDDGVMRGVVVAEHAARHKVALNVAFEIESLPVLRELVEAGSAAALLPCPWTYHALGDVVVDVEHLVYSEWARFYSEGLLAESCRAWRELVDGEVAETGPRTAAAMRRVFHLSMRYEWMFWQMAYTRERWPIE